MSRMERRLMYVGILGQIFISLVFTSEIFFRGDRYLKYSPSRLFQDLDSVNRVSLSFRTFHPSGILVFMIGSQGDYLSVRLVQGKLSYDLAQQFKRFSSVLIGNNLNDNLWHSLHIFRIGRINEVTLDKIVQPVLVEKRHEKLSVSETFFIGGLDKELAFATQLPSDIFTGCLNVAELDSRDPFAYLIDGSKRVEVLPTGPMSFSCEQYDPETIELTKPSSSLVLKSGDRRALTTLSLSFMMRTFHLDGNVVAAVKKGFLLTLSVDGGRVSMEVRARLAGSAISKLVSQDFVANGLWHRISVEVTATDMMLLIDNDSKLSSAMPRTNDGSGFSSPYLGTLSELVFGAFSATERGGFVGCVTDITLNNVPANITGLRGSAELLNGARKGCQLQDKCSPNPCRNAGKCDQTWKGYTCDCRGTSFYGEHCEINIYKETCAAYQAIGLSANSYCLIDTDGLGDLPPFTTLCKFGENNLAYTTVHHNKELQFSASEGEEKFQSYIFHKFKYELSMSQIEALIKSSFNCRQFVRFRCYNAMLLNSPSGPANVVWRSRTGEVKTHWGGVTMDGDGCACGVNHSCIKADRLCNCDFRSNRWTEDSGFLTDKRFLPITRLDVTDIKDGFGYFDIGPLECFGTSSEDIHQAPHDVLSNVCLSVSDSEALLSSANSSKLTLVRTEQDPATALSNEQSFQLEKDAKLHLSNKSVTFRTNLDLPVTTKSRNLAQLSILEICLIAIAALGTVTLIAKFLVCKLYRHLYEHPKFNQVAGRRSFCSDRNLLTATAIMNCSDPDRTVLPTDDSKKKQPLEIPVYECEQKKSSFIQKQQGF